MNQFQLNLFHEFFFPLWSPYRSFVGTSKVSCRTAMRRARLASSPAGKRARDFMIHRLHAAVYGNLSQTVTEERVNMGGFHQLYSIPSTVTMRTVIINCCILTLIPTSNMHESIPWNSARNINNSWKPPIFTISQQVPISDLSYIRWKYIHNCMRQHSRVNFKVSQCQLKGVYLKITQHVQRLLKIRNASNNKKRLLN